MSVIRSEIKRSEMKPHWLFEYDRLLTQSVSPGCVYLAQVLQVDQGCQAWPWGSGL